MAAKAPPVGFVQPVIPAFAYCCARNSWTRLVHGGIGGIAKGEASTKYRFVCPASLRWELTFCHRVIERPDAFRAFAT
jgi:hypothetical protein